MVCVISPYHSALQVAVINYAGTMEASDEWLEWFSLTPVQRFIESQRMWPQFLLLGGNYDPEPDHQSPFFDAEEWCRLSTHGRAGMHIIRRSGI